MRLELISGMLIREPACAAYGPCSSTVCSSGSPRTSCGGVEFFGRGLIRAILKDSVWGYVIIFKVFLTGSAVIELIGDVFVQELSFSSEALFPWESSSASLSRAPWWTSSSEALSLGLRGERAHCRLSPGLPGS